MQQNIFVQSIHLSLILIICLDGVGPNLELITPEVDVTSHQLRQKMAPAQLPLSTRTRMLSALVNFFILPS